MAYWSNQWHIFRIQQSDSADWRFRQTFHHIVSTPNFVWALQKAFSELPDNPTGSATRSFVRVRHVSSNTSDSVHYINAEAYGHTILRQKNNVTIDFENNEFITEGGTGAFINAASLQGLTICNLTLHSRPYHTGAHAINLQGTHNTTIEGFRNHRNHLGGTGIRADGRPGQWWMWNLLIHGNMHFTGGGPQKFAVETMTVNGLNMGHIKIDDAPGGICVNNGTNTSIYKVEGNGVSPGASSNYALMRFANNCEANNAVGEIYATRCGRALATVSSPNINLWAGYIQAVNCTELGIRLNGGNGIFIKAAYIQGGVGYGGIDISDGTYNATINNFMVGWTAGHGIIMNGVQNQLLNGQVVACGRSGILVGGYKNTISNCNVRENAGTGIGLGGNSSVVKHTAIYYNRNLGIEVTGGPVGIENCWSDLNKNGSRNRGAYVSNSSIDWR
jgi:hypothetical protein